MSNRTLYQRLLGPDFDRLPPVLRYFHGLPDGGTAAGFVTVERSQGVLRQGAVFGSLAWIAWHGSWAWVFAAILLFEIGITLWDFVEEDVTRKLPAGERIMYTIMAIVYGAFLACLVPQVIAWWRQPSGLTAVNHGYLSWILSFFALGVFLSGIRDVYASFRMKPIA